MATRRQFQPAGTSRGFRDVGRGLQSSRYELQQQAQRITDSMKQQKLESKEAQKSTIQGLTDKARFEEGVLAEKHKLEQAVRNRQYEALSIKADRHVSRLEGEAKEAEKYAKHLQDIAPKRAKMFGKLAKGIWDFTEYQEYRFLNNQDIKKGTFNYADEEFQKTRKALYAKHLKDSGKVHSADEWNLFIQSFNGRDNDAYATGKLQEIQGRRGFYENSINAHVGNQNLNLEYGNVKDLYNEAAYAHLSFLGIDPRSRGGREIIKLYDSWAIDKQNGFINGERSKQTITNMNLLSEQIFTGKDGEIDITRGNFAKLVKTIQLGTFSTKEGYTSGPVNKAEAVELAMTHLVETNYKNIHSAREMRTFLEKFTILGDELKGDKAQIYAKVHAGRVDNVLKTYGRLKEQERDLSKIAAKASDTQNIAEFDLALENHNKFKADGVDGSGNEYTVTDEEFNLSWVEKAVRFNKGTEVSKNYIFQHAGIPSNAYSLAGNWAQIEDAFLSGDNKLAYRLFAKLDGAAQEKLKYAFQSIDLVQKSGMSYGDLATKALEIHQRNEEQGLGGKKDLHDSGTASVYKMVGRILNNYNSLVESGVPHKKAMEEAIKIEEAEYARGYDFKNMESGEGAYKRDYGIFPNYVRRKHRKFVYSQAKNFSKEDPVFSVDQWESILNQGEDGPLDFSDSKLLTRILNGDGLIADQEFNDLEVVAQNLAKDVTLFSGEPISIDVPPIITLLSKKFNTSETEIINALLKNRGSSYRFTDDGHDATNLKNGNKYVAPNNLLGTNYFNAAMTAQNVRPTDNMTAIYFNNGRQVLDSHCVQHELPQLNVVSDLQNYDIDTSKKFYETGGTHYIGFEDMESLFGLQGMTRWVGPKGKIHVTDPY